MKKLNIFYWFIWPILGYAAYLLVNELKLSHREYFGFAENKQSEINLDKDVTVAKLMVRTGDKVKKGQLLMVVKNTEISQQINQITTEENGLKIKNDLNQAELRAEILKLEKEREIEIAGIQTKINHAKEEDEFFKKISINGHDNIQRESTLSNNPNTILISNLEKEIDAIRLHYNNQISQYKRMILQPQQTKTEKAIFNGAKTHLKSELEKFNIVAPFDGIVGSVNARENENIKAFTSLISFYELTPPLVMGYVQEKYDLNINVGDSVQIASVYNPNKKIRGVIASKGSRIVEIPEKFRKIPDNKIYGIEVFINIPHNNSFLQKEVLKISEIP